MIPMRALPCLLLVLLSGCVLEEAWVDLDLDDSAFVNRWILEGQATRTVLLAEGYQCPDGRTARVDLLRPTGFEGPRPLALLLHDGVYEWLDDTSSTYENTVNRLGALYADDQVAAMFGVDGALVDGNARGSWAASLLQAGYAVAAPGNCWGDLWHGRGDNDLQGEGFLRQGARLAADAIRLATEQPDVTDQRLIAVGLGEGGRGIVELALDGVDFDAVVVDGSPDWLSPVTQRPAWFQRYITGLERIWFAEIPADLPTQERLTVLQGLLQRDSLVHLITDLGWRVPIVYASSPTDEIVDADMTLPAAQAIGPRYAEGQSIVDEWPGPEHVPSNSERGYDAVQGYMTWIGELLGDFVYLAPPAAPAP